MKKLFSKMWINIKKAWPLIIIAFVIISFAALSLVNHYMNYDSGINEDIIYKLLPDNYLGKSVFFKTDLPLNERLGELKKRLNKKLMFFYKLN